MYFIVVVFIFNAFDSYYFIDVIKHPCQRQKPQQQKRKKSKILII